MRLRGEGKKVVVADDAPEVLELLTLILEQRGFEVFGFSNGLDAWRSLPEIRPDLILLDIIMPGMDGLELCGLIKGHADLKATPVFLLTSATAGSEVADGFWKIGTDADAFFSKPFNPHEVLAHVDQALFGAELPADFRQGAQGGGAARVSGD